MHERRWRLAGVWLALRPADCTVELDAPLTTLRDGRVAVHVRIDIEDSQNGIDWFDLSVTRNVNHTTAKRSLLVDSSQKHEGSSFFLISLKADGSRLNLTAASYVVLFDPWWNPAVKALAIDHTHRIGQNRMSSPTDSL